MLTYDNFSIIKEDVINGITQKEMCKKYESMYGPLTIGDNGLDENRWEWINSPWPWEVM